MGLRWLKGRVKRKYLLLFVIALLVVASDQITKSWVIQRFRLGESLPVISDLFSLTYVQNKGAAFGILAQSNPNFRGPFFVVVPLIALFSIAYVFRKIPEGEIKLSAALSLVVSGAIGNLIDRLTLGYVIDFLDFHWQWKYHFPAFNVADSAICIGVGILMLDLITSESPSRPKKGPQANVSSTH